MKILHSKLQAPRTGDVVRRKGDGFLSELMAARRITTVTAGAGYGKSTFVALAVGSLDTVWYRLSGTDRDFSVFLNYLAAGISRYYPGFDGEVREFLQDEMTVDQDAHAVLTSFLHGVERHVDRPLMIVLDDFHEVQESAGIIESVQFLVEHLPADIHIVLVGRIQAGLTLSRLRVMREVVEITEKDLAFSPPEVSSFFEEIFGMSLDPGAADMIHSRSQGWVSGLILFYHAIRDLDPGDVTGFITRLQGSGRSISQYLEENVFSFMPGESRDFLLKTSLLSRLSSSLCDAFLEITDSGSRLEYLEKNHFFTTLVDEAAQEYTYHHLFRDFLSSRLLESFDAEEIRALHLKAAVLCERSDMVEEAVSHYLDARDYCQASRILAAEGMKMVAEGRINLLNSFLGRIPQQVESADPWLVYVRGCISEVSGLPQKAMEELHRARVIFEDKGSQTGMDLCDFSLGNIYCPMGYFRKAEELFLKVLESPSCDPMVSLMIRAQMVFITASLGKIDESDRYCQEGMRDAAQVADPAEREQMQAWFAVTHGVRYIMSGDLHKAISRVEEARLPLEKTRQYRLLNSYYNHISLACYHAGLFEKGLEHAEKGLALLREKGFRDNLQGWLLLSNCFNCVGLRRIPEAFEYGRQAQKSFQDFGSPWGEAVTCVAFGMLHLRIGDVARAEESIHEGLALLENMDFPQIKGQFILGLALIRTLQGRLGEAEDLLAQAATEIPPSKIFSWWEMCIRTCLASFQGRRSEALGYAVNCLEIARENRYETLVADQLILLLVPLADLYEQGVMREYLQGVFAMAGPEFRETLSQLLSMGDTEIGRAGRTILGVLPQTPPPGLRVTTLGRFQLVRGSEEVAARDWSSRKARMLFKLLVHYRSKGYVNKEVFMEHLWPDEDPQKTAKRFHVALAALRKILEPSVHRGIASSYILSEGDNYLLDTGPEGFIDIEEFDRACAAAGEAADDGEALLHLLRAEDLCRGEFLEEDLYEPWCAAERERIRERYLSVLASIVEYFEAKKDYARAIDYCGRYLAKDAYAEDMYQRLMRFHNLLGNRAMVKKAYEKCRKNLRDLDCPLSRETQDLVRELIEEGA